MSLKQDLTASLKADAEQAIIKKLGDKALQQYPHLAAMYAAREADYVVQQVQSLFALRKRKGVTWHQVADIYNRVQACDGGTRLQDAKDALNEREKELEDTIADLDNKKLPKTQKQKLLKRKSYREARVAKAKLHVASCQKKQDEIDSLLAKVTTGGTTK